MISDQFNDGIKCGWKKCKGMCCNFQKAARRCLVESTGLRPQPLANRRRIAFFMISSGYQLPSAKVATQSFDEMIIKAHQCRSSDYSCTLGSSGRVGRSLENGSREATRDQGYLTDNTGSIKFVQHS